MIGVGDDELAFRLSQGTHVERDYILEDLRQRADESRDPDDFHRLALVCLKAGGGERGGGALFLEAAEILNILRLATSQAGGSDVYRTTLATTCDNLDLQALSRFHFQWLAENGARDRHREIGREQVERLDAEATRIDSKLRKLHLEFALERASGATADLKDYERLGRAMLYIDPEASTELVEPIRAVLALANEAFPADVPVMQGLLLCLLRLGEKDGHDRILLALEEEAPESPWLESVAELIASGAGADAAYLVVFDTAASIQNYLVLGEIVAFLLRQYDDPEPEVAGAALLDLRRYAAKYPHHQECVFGLGFALLRAGDFDALTALTQRILAAPEETHTYHYNIGQLLWSLGERESGVHHMYQAVELAENDGDAADAHVLLAEWEEVAR